jgi:CelD/BcsL family acetyltransferase involved in cellulose biosynthesis
MNLRFELLKHLDQFIEIRGEWRELWARSHGDYYLSFESVLISWEKIHEPLGRRFCLAIVRDGSTLLGALPMALYRRAFWRVASPIDPESCQGTDMLLAEATEPAIGDALFRFFVREVRPDVIALEFVREGNALDRAVRDSGIAPVITQTEVVPCAILHDQTSWTGYERSLSSSTRLKTGRKQRRMNEAGAVTFEIVEGEADAGIDWLLDEKAKWGRKANKLGRWLFSADYRAYLKAYAARGDRVLTFILRFNGAPAAVKVVAVGPSLCTLVIAAYDEALSNFSPGNILDGFWIKHIFENFSGPGGKKLDICFGAGVEHYKMYWGNGFKYGSTTYRLPVSRWGRAAYRAKAVMRALTRYVKR